MALPGWRSRWGRTLAGSYILLISAATGFVSYRLLFAHDSFDRSGLILSRLGLPWTRTLGGVIDPASGGAIWLVLLVSFAVNTLMLLFVGSRLEQLARSERS